MARNSYNSRRYRGMDDKPQSGAGYRAIDDAPPSGGAYRAIDDVPPTVMPGQRSGYGAKISDNVSRRAAEIRWAESAVRRFKTVDGNWEMEHPRTRQAAGWQDGEGPELFDVTPVRVGPTQPAGDGAETMNADGSVTKASGYGSIKWSGDMAKYTKAGKAAADAAAIGKAWAASLDSVTPETFSKMPADTALRAAGPIRSSTPRDSGASVPADIVSQALAALDKGEATSEQIDALRAAGVAGGDGGYDRLAGAQKRWLDSQLPTSVVESRAPAPERVVDAQDILNIVRPVGEPISSIFGDNSLDAALMEFGGQVAAPAVPTYRAGRFTGRGWQYREPADPVRPMFGVL